MNNVYRVTLLNPAANPDEIEEEFIYADDQKEAELEAIALVARHPFNDVSLLSVDLVEPGELYHDES